MNISSFIRENIDWRDKLKQKPYSLSCHTSQKYPNLFLLKYGQFESDFHNVVVKECRGIILHIDETSIIPVCVPFYKFGNYGEDYNDLIDWNTAQVQEKVDGSIMKLWFYHQMNKWIISTNGTVDAFECNLPYPSENIRTFGDAFMRAIELQNLEEFANRYDLDRNKTYIFELTGKYNKVIIDYPVEIHQIGVRNNLTLMEEICNLPIKKPKTYKFSSLEDTIKFARTLSGDEEGFVVVDGNWHRIKIKGTAYVKLHHTKNTAMTPKNILSLILNNEYIEYQIYFPEMTPSFVKMKSRFDNFLMILQKQLNEIEELKNDVLHNKKTMREYAEKANSTINRNIMFDFLKNKFSDVKEYIIQKYSPDIILDWLHE